MTVRDDDLAGGGPSDVAAPRDASDLVDVLAADTGPFEVLGGGSKRSVGRPLTAKPLALGELHGVIEYEPQELVLTARAGTPLAAIERLLGSERQRLAFEPPSYAALLDCAAEPTLGGVVAANVAGSRRIVAGAARDHLLGCRAVNGRGEAFTAGSRVVKNVTGYDLPKLLAGSWGTLAVLTEVTMRVAPAAETECTLRLPASGLARGIELMTRALGSPCEVSGAAFSAADGVLLRLEGFAASVQARAARLLTLLGAAHAERLDGIDSVLRWRTIGAAAALAPWPVVWRLSVPPSDAARVIAALEPDAYLLDWGGGLIWAAAPTADASRVREAVAPGHATLFKAPAAERAATPVFMPQPAALAAVAARLKAAFDPAGKLNPGRMD